jgi:membrane protein implicated in regulation of membrane protease activity
MAQPGECSLTSFRRLIMTAGAFAIASEWAIPAGAFAVRILFVAVAGAAWLLRRSSSSEPAPLQHSGHRSAEGRTDVPQDRASVYGPDN